ncbi:MAG TPA: SGNH/GDSL hydrolase family protein [Armatimonadota bacterium]|nr:SGNH/GDSL hydrolase family protein [Armatimonadota bacterium]
MTISHITALIAVCVLACAARADDAVPMTPKTAALLENGQEPVTVACFGDSITGVYYHTGGVRAYTDMLGIALKRIYPQGEISMVNAGISGNTTAAGLQRIERDVLSRNPQLVTIMFGMNDVTGTPAGAYRANLESIVEQCRGVGAEVVLCTPNSVYPEDAGRPMDKLGAFAQTVRDLGAELGVPVAD